MPHGIAGRSSPAHPLIGRWSTPRISPRSHPKWHYINDHGLDLRFLNQMNRTDPCTAPLEQS